MKVSKRTLLFYALALFVTCMYVERATAKTTFWNLRLEHNVMHDGQQCLAIHAKVIATGVISRVLTCTAYVDCPKGTRHQDTNGRYRANDGQVAASNKAQCPYMSGVWEDFVIYLPNDEIHPKAGKNDYYVHLEAWDGSIFQGESGYVSFSMTGSENSGGNAAGNGGGQGNICPTCMGTGRMHCYRCDGKGWDAYLGRCAECQGTGRHYCYACGATGYIK